MGHSLRFLLTEGLHCPIQISLGKYSKNSLIREPPPPALPRCPWKVPVHTTNSPEGKKSHNTQGHQQLDQQDCIDLGFRRSSGQLRGAPLEAREAQAPSDAQGVPQLPSDSIYSQDLRPVPFPFFPSGH